MPIISSSKSWQIVELSRKQLDTAARIYAQGLLMEEPPGSTEPLEELTKSLHLHLEIYLHQKGNRHIWLAFENEVIKGLVDFYHKSDELFIRFICAIPPRRGTGTQILWELANYAQSHDIESIKTTVSSLDTRALNFYFKRLGFHQVGTRIEEPGFELLIVAIQPQVLLNAIQKKRRQKEKRGEPSR